MNEDILKEKYFFLKEQLYTVKDKLENLEENIEIVQVSMNKAILIDKKIVDEELFFKTQEKIKTIKQQIVSELIPMVNNKL